MGKQNFFRDYKQDVLNHVFPSNWKNPTPKEVYDLIVIGAGPGGMTSAIAALELNATVAIIEKQHFGGECFNVGCIPSKAFLRSSKCVAEIRNAAEYGIEVHKGWTVNFPAVMQRVRRLQSLLAPHDSAEHFKKLGADVFLGEAHFNDVNTIQVGREILRFKKAIIATGTKPLIPEIEGIEKAGYLTNQTVFDIKSLPSRLAVIGGGPIGCELAQAFLRFGSQVILITRGKQLLPKDDSMASERLRNVFEKEGMQILFQTQVQRVEKKGKEKILYLDNGKELTVDEILIGVGRLPAVEGLDLEKAGIKYDIKKGIESNDFLQTSNPNVYSVGDVGSRYKFTHMSKELANLAVQNALNDGKLTSSTLIVPWSTYTDPEVAHVGLQEKEVQEKGIAAQSVIIEMKNTDRAILDGETIGFVKIHVNLQTGQILGGTIMAKHGGEMISELTTAIVGEKGIAVIADSIHPFPTQAEAVRADALSLVKELNNAKRKQDI